MLTTIINGLLKKQIRRCLIPTDVAPELKYFSQEEIDGMYLRAYGKTVAQGFCDGFAEKVARAARKFGFKVLTVWICDRNREHANGERCTCHHAVVYQNRYYDSETPEGVESPLNLPMFVRRGTTETFVCDLHQQARTYGTQ